MSPSRRWILKSLVNWFIMYSGEVKMKWWIYEFHIYTQALLPCWEWFQEPHTRVFHRTSRFSFRILFSLQTQSQPWQKRTHQFINKIVFNFGYWGVQEQPQEHSLVENVSISLSKLNFSILGWRMPVYFQIMAFQHF